MSKVDPHYCVGAPKHKQLEPFKHLNMELEMRIKLVAGIRLREYLKMANIILFIYLFIFYRLQFAFAF